MSGRVVNASQKEKIRSLKMLREDLWPTRFLSGIDPFASMVEGKIKNLNIPDLGSLKKPYSLLSKIEKLENIEKYHEQDAGFGIL